MKCKWFFILAAVSGALVAWSSAGHGCAATAQTPETPDANADAREWLKSIGFGEDEIAKLPELVSRARARRGNPAAFANLKKGDTVVDLGCGAGVDCLLAAGRVGSSGKVIGVDMSPEAIAAAEGNRRKTGAVNVEFRKGYLENLPLEDESVDVAISNCVAPVMQGKAIILRQVLRVLKPGGQLVFNTAPVRDDAPADVLPGEDRETAYLARLRAAGFAKVEVGARIPPPDPIRAKIMVVATKAGPDRDSRACCSGVEKNQCSPPRPKTGCGLESPKAKRSRTTATTGCCAKQAGDMAKGKAQSQTPLATDFTPAPPHTAAKAATQREQIQPAASSSKKAGEQPAEQWAKAVARLKKIGYTDQDIAFLPRGAVLASAGAKHVVFYAELKPGEVAVDLGCGGGIDCLLAARRVGPSGKVIGVDMSAKALATARQNLQELGLTNVEFRQGRLEKLPLEDASVDVAISNCVGIVMRGDAAVLSEAARVLKPGGRLVTTGRLRDEYRGKLLAAGFTTVEQPAQGMIVARKPE